MVGTLAVCFSIANFIDTEELALIGGANEVASTLGLTSVTALAYLMFNLFTPPCFAAIGAMNSEMKSAKWLWGAIGFQLGIGFTIGYLVSTIGTLIIDASALHIGGAIGGGIAVVVFAAILIYLCIISKKKFQAELALKSEKEKVSV